MVGPRGGSLFNERDDPVPHSGLRKDSVDSPSVNTLPREIPEGCRLVLPISSPVLGRHPMLDTGLVGGGTTWEEDAQGTPTQCPISPSILAYEDYTCILVQYTKQNSMGVYEDEDYTCIRRQNIPA